MDSLNVQFRNEVRTQLIDLIYNVAIFRIQEHDDSRGKHYFPQAPKIGNSFVRLALDCIRVWGIQFPEYKFYTDKLQELNGYFPPITYFKPESIQQVQHVQGQTPGGDSNPKVDQLINRVKQIFQSQKETAQVKQQLQEVSAEFDILYEQQIQSTEVEDFIVIYMDYTEGKTSYAEFREHYVPNLNFDPYQSQLFSTGSIIQQPMKSEIKGQQAQQQQQQDGAYQEIIEQLQQENNRVHLLLANESEHKKKLEEQIHTYQGKTEELNAKVLQLQNQLQQQEQTYTKKVQQIEQQKQSLEKQHQELIHHQGAAQNTQGDKDRKIQELEYQNAEQIQNLQNVHEELIQMSEQHKQQQKQHAELTSTSNRQLQEIQKHQESNKSLQQQIQDLTQKNLELTRREVHLGEATTKQINQLEKQVQELNNQNDQLKKELKSFQLKNHDQQIISLSSQIDSLKHENDYLRQSMIEKQKEFEQMKQKQGQQINQYHEEEFENLKVENSILKQQITSLQQNPPLKQEYELLKIKYDKLDTLYYSLQEEQNKSGIFAASNKSGIFSTNNNKSTILNKSIGNTSQIISKIQRSPIPERKLEPEITFHDFTELDLLSEPEEQIKKVDHDLDIKELIYPFKTAEEYYTHHGKHVYKGFFIKQEVLSFSNDFKAACFKNRGRLQILNKLEIRHKTFALANRLYVSTTLSLKNTNLSSYQVKIQSTGPDMWVKDEDKTITLQPRQTMLTEVIRRVTDPFELQKVSILINLIKYDLTLPAVLLRTLEVQPVQKEIFQTKYKASSRVYKTQTLRMHPYLQLFCNQGTMLNSHKMQDITRNICATKYGLLVRDAYLRIILRPNGEFLIQGFGGDDVQRLMNHLSFIYSI